MTRVKRETWARRVAEWRASGLTSMKFSESRDFTAGGLRHWAYRLGKTKQRRREPRVRIARVVRSPAVVSVSREISTSAPEEVDSALAVELDGARVVVRAGFDRATLAAVLEVLATHRGAQ